MENSNIFKDLNRNTYDNAAYIISYFSSKQKEVSYQKLNRLLYLLEAIFMVFTKEDYLFEDEFYAYNFEIANAKIVNNFKKFSSFAIELENNVEIPKTNILLIEGLYTIFGEFTTAQLVSFTTRSGSPWNRLNDHYHGIIDKKIIIDKTDTKNWFESMVDIDE